MKILCFPCGPYETNMYIVFCEQTLEAVIVDPGQGASKIFTQNIQSLALQPKAIWLTHSHWDHIVDVAKIKREFSIPIYLHADDQRNLEQPGSDQIEMAIPTVQAATPDHLIQEGDLLKVGKASFKVFHTPGHSPGGVCFYCEKEHVLFSGDTFFKGLIGSLSLPTSEETRMWQSLARLAMLPPETTVFPGHGPSTTIQDEAWLKRAEEIGKRHHS